MPKKKSAYSILDESTGVLTPIRHKSTKRTEDFYMTKQKDAIALAKMKLSGMEHNVLLLLEGLMNYDSVVTTSQKYLATELNSTEATISACISSLSEKGLITKSEQNGVRALIVNSHVSERGKQKKKEEEE